MAEEFTSEGLARDIRAKADAPIWHENDDGRFALKITKAGREAIGVEEDEDAELSCATPAPKAQKAAGKPASKKHVAKAAATRPEGYAAGAQDRRS